MLRDAAVAARLAERRPPPPGQVAAMFGAVIFGIVMWAVELQRLGVVAVRTARGFDDVPPLWSYVTAARIALAWQTIAGAVALGAILLLALLLLPPTRRFTRHFPVVPFFAGAAIWLGVWHVIALL